MGWACCGILLDLFCRGTRWTCCWSMGLGAGTKRVECLEENMGALGVELTSEDMAALEAAVPHHEVLHALNNKDVHFLLLPSYVLEFVTPQDLLCSRSPLLVRRRMPARHGAHARRHS